MHKVWFGREQKVFSMNEMHVELPFPCDYITSRNSYCKRVVTSTAESKRRWTYNVISAFSWSGIYIYIYIYNSFKFPVRWQKQFASTRNGSTTLSLRNCAITLGWQLMRAGYHMCFYTLYDEKKIYEYAHICIIYTGVYMCLSMYVCLSTSIYR